MTSNDAGATSSSINSPIAPSLMPTLSPAPSLTLSPVSTTSGNLIHRPFAGGLLSAGGELPGRPAPRDVVAGRRRTRRGTAARYLADRRYGWRVSDRVLQGGGVGRRAARDDPGSARTVVPQ